MNQKTGRKPLPAYKRRTKYIKINLTESEHKLVENAKNRLKEHSPALTLQDLFRKILFQIDDKAFQEYLDLEENSQIKLILRSSSILGTNKS